MVLSQTVKDLQHFIFLVQDPPKGVGPGGANTSEGVLANFFNSLLNKKTGQGMAGGGISPAGAQIKPQVGNDECKWLLDSLQFNQRLLDQKAILFICKAILFVEE